MKAEMQMREFAQQKKDRELDRLARQKVKQQIEQDKRDRAARFAKEKAEREGLATTSQQQQQQDGAVKPSLLQAGLPKVSSNTGMARLQFRPMVKSVEGIQPFTHVFNAEDTLDQVVEFVKEKTGIKHFHLATTFPKKVFGTHHYSKTLKELGLAPSAALAMTD
ncbi:hypothetical protein GGI12_003655 [Dipsacomyces acuminosporus]|nr:hypothetical protein GGI12_003655 [Dipsacomyces acuminosporus]